MSKLPPKIAALLVHGVARAPDLRAGAATQIDALIGSGILCVRPGGLIVHPAGETAWTPIVEVQLRSAGAVGSQRLAAWTYQAEPFDTRRPEYLDFVSTAGSRAAKVQRVARLDPVDIRDLGSIRVTTPARTLADLGSIVSDQVVERVGESMLRQDLVTEAELRATAKRLRRHRGVAALNRFLDRRGEGTPPTGSDLETRFVQVARRLGYPEPLRQVPIARPNGRPYRADFGWQTPKGLVVAEVDGAGTHANPDALTRDLRRQNEMTRTAHVILRFTIDDIDRHPHNIDRDLIVHVPRRRPRSSRRSGERAKAA